MPHRRITSLLQEEPSPSASLGLASLQKGFAGKEEKAAKDGQSAPNAGGFQWQVVKETYSSKQDAAAKATWHFFDRLSTMPSSVLDGARAELEKAGMIEPAPPPSNLARMAGVAAAAGAAGAAAAAADAEASAPPPAPPEPEPKQLSNADRRALGLPPAKPVAPKRPKQPETEEELEAEMKKLLADSQKRVERMRGQKNERSLEKAAEVLLHDTAWLPGTAKQARLQDVKGLRKQWIELLRGLQQELTISINASLVAKELQEKADREQEAEEVAAAFAEHEALWKKADERKAEEQQAKQQAAVDEQQAMADQRRQMSACGGLDASGAVAANASAALGKVVAEDTTLRVDGSVVGADGTPLGVMKPDGMVVGKYNAVLGFRKPDGKVCSALTTRHEPLIKPPPAPNEPL